MSPLAVEVEIVPALPWHAVSLAERMRKADRDEVFAATGKSPLDALEYSLAKSTIAKTALVNEVPEVMFGVGDLNILTQVGAPWLLGSDAVERHYVAFLRGSVEWRDQLLQRYEVLKNLVDDRNKASIRWLRWLGFTLSEPVKMGHENRPFRLFELRRGDFGRRAEKFVTSL